MRKKKFHNSVWEDTPDAVIHPVRWNMFEGMKMNSADFYATRYFQMFYKIGCGRFDMKLPDTIFLPGLFSSFLRNAWALFTKIGLNEYYFGQFQSGGDLDIYGIPKTRYVTFKNGKTIERDRRNSVIVQLNSERHPEIGIINSYAHQLGELDAQIEVNLIACKTPVVVMGDEKVIKQINQQWKNIKDNDQLLTLRNGKDITSLFTTFDLKPTYYVDKLQEQKRHLIKECCNMLGVVFQDEKPERLITSEVQSLNAFVSPIRNDMLLNLNQGFDEINSMFFADSNFKVKVDLKGDVIDVREPIGISQSLGRSETNISESAQEN